MKNDWYDESRPALTRRRFLNALGGTAAATMLGGAPRLRAADVRHPEATADSCILLWMAGGMASAETLDPKRYHPYEIGTPVDKIISTFPAIDTNVDGIQFCEGLEGMASIMDRGSLIRSHYQPDLGSILHSRHQYHWHTGYVPPTTVAAPHIGAWMAKVIGGRNEVMPPFINIGQRLEGIGESEELKAFTTGGFFGSEFGPMNLPYPEEASQAVQPPGGMSADRFARRYKALQALIKNSPKSEHLSDYHQESMLRSVDNAHRLLGSPERKAFDLSLEDKDVYKAYDTGRFGRGCLLARRLVENGARFVEVTTEYVPFLQWDTHENGHETAARMKKEIDQPITTLIKDLESKGMLERTLVIVATEFSRDMMIEGVPGSDAKDQSRAVTDFIKEPFHYGLHRHFTGGSSVLMFGGGMKKGFLYGDTADERPCLVTKNPVSIEDLHATIYRAMGISPKTAYDIETRPFYATKDGKGKPVMDLFA